MRTKFDKLKFSTKKRKKNNNKKNKNQIMLVWNQNKLNSKGKN